MNPSLAAALAFIEDIHATHAITLNANLGAVPINRLRKLFSLFCLQIDRLRFGRRAIAQMSHDRFDAIAFPEHLAANAHLHVAANLSPQWWRIDMQTLERELQNIWHDITKGHGSIYLKPIFSDGWGRYIAKELNFLTDRHLNEGEDYFWSRDFHSGDSVLKSSQLRKILDTLRP